MWVSTLPLVRSSTSLLTAPPVLPRILAEDVTLYQLAADPPSTTDSVIRSGYSIGITPVSVEKSGETAYVAAEAQSRAVYTNRFTTLTLVPSPTTVTCAFIPCSSLPGISELTWSNWPLNYFSQILSAPTHRGTISRSRRPSTA